LAGQAGAVAAALVTGKRGLIDDETNDALRAAGIYHIVSISGLHMVSPPARSSGWWRGAGAERRVRPCAGLQEDRCRLPAWRAHRLLPVLGRGGGDGALADHDPRDARRGLVDRPAISMRNLAIAASRRLAREPETILGPSFQMSFAAVGALVASGEWWRAATARRPRRPGPPRGTLARRRGPRLLATTVVAGIATAPFASFHFQAANPYGVHRQCPALPLVSLVVMPARARDAGLPVRARPPGVGAHGAAVDGVCEAPRSLPISTARLSSTAAYGPGALGLMALGLVLVSCSARPCGGSAWRRPGRLVALDGARAARPHVDREGTGVAVRRPTGASPSRAALGFVVGQWLRATATTASPMTRPCARRRAAIPAGLRRRPRTGAPSPMWRTGGPFRGLPSRRDPA
jgi:competence protein ComEC